MNKKLISVLALVSVVFVISLNSVYAMRVVKPPYFTDITQSDQRSQLNKFIEDTWLMQGGRFELDIVSTTKTDAKNGEIWMLTGPVMKIQFKAGDTIYSITPD